MGMNDLDFLVGGGFFCLRVGLDLRLDRWAWAGCFSESNLFQITFQSTNFREVKLEFQILWVCNF